MFPGVPVCAHVPEQASERAHAGACTPRFPSNSFDSIEGLDAQIDVRTHLIVHSKVTLYNELVIELVQASQLLILLTEPGAYVICLARIRFAGSVAHAHAYTSIRWLLHGLGLGICARHT